MFSNQKISRCVSSPPQGAVPRQCLAVDLLHLLRGEVHQRPVVLSSLNLGSHELFNLRTGPCLETFLYIPTFSSALSSCSSLVIPSTLSIGFRLVSSTCIKVSILRLLKDTTIELRRSTEESSLENHSHSVGRKINLFSSCQLGVALKDPFHGKRPSAAVPGCVVIAVHCKITLRHSPQKVPVEGLAWKCFAKKKPGFEAAPAP